MLPSYRAMPEREFPFDLSKPRYGIDQFEPLKTNRSALLSPSKSPTKKLSPEVIDQKPSSEPSYRATHCNPTPSDRNSPRYGLSQSAPLKTNTSCFPSPSKSPM